MDAGGHLVAIRQINAAIDMLQTASAADLTHDEAVSVALGIFHVCTRLDGTYVHIKEIIDATADRAQSWKDARDATIGESKGDPSKEQNLDAVRAWLRDYETFTQAFKDGLLTVEHIQVLKRATNGRNAVAMRETQEFFVEQAQVLSFVQFKKAVKYWQSASDPDGERPSDREPKSRLSFRKRHDGMTQVSGLLDPVLAQTILTPLHAEAEKMFRAQEAAAPGHKRFVNHGSLYAEALGVLAGRASTVNDKTALVPTVSLTLGYELAQNILERQFDPSIPKVDPCYFDPNRRCEFADGTLCHPDDAAILMAIGTFRWHVLNDEGRVIAVAAKSRSFPVWMKRILLLESRGLCTVDGCDAPYHWLVGDHIIPYAKGGTTELSNGGLKCSGHNHRKSDFLDQPPESAPDPPEEESDSDSA